MANSAGTDGRDANIPRTLALIIGVIYTLVGILGFFVTGFGDFVDNNTDETLLGFEINGLHNVVHLLIGVAGIALSRTLATARTYGWLLAIGYGAVFIFGLFAAGDDVDYNFLSLNAADNWLHALSALAGLAIALWPVRGADRTDVSGRGRGL